VAHVQFNPMDLLVQFLKDAQSRGISRYIQAEAKPIKGHTKSYHVIQDTRQSFVGLIAPLQIRMMLPPLLCSAQQHMCYRKKGQRTCWNVMPTDHTKSSRGTFGIVGHLLCLTALGTVAQHYPLSWLRWKARHECCRSPPEQQDTPDD